jgi:hypothetical protein
MGKLRELLLPILTEEEALPPLVLIHEITSVIAKFTRRSGVDLNAIILMCWSEAQTNERVKAEISGFQLRYRASLAQIVVQWQKSKYLKSRAKPEDLAKALLSFFYGFIVQSALLGELHPNTVVRGMEGILAGLRPSPEP